MNEKVFIESTSYYRGRSSKDTIRKLNRRINLFFLTAQIILGTTFYRGTHPRAPLINLPLLYNREYLGIVKKYPVKISIFLAHRRVQIKFNQKVRCAIETPKNQVCFHINERNLRTLISKLPLQ